LIPNAFADNVPDWVKNTAGWWAEDVISETEFVNAIEYLVKENIIQVNVSQTSETSQGVPDWVKNTAGWWAEDVISETEFVNAIAYLIKVGIISVESSKSPELIAEMWVNGDINDDEFLANVEQLIEKDVITIQNDSVIKTSQLPDWLVNNAGWWAARIITDSDFNFDPGYVKEKIYPCDEYTISNSCIQRTYNSHGFRGNEFEKEKPDNIFRIFAVGGSTTFGAGAEDDETWSVYLQKIINETVAGKNIEVMNFGLSGATTESYYELIKNKITSLDPDLIIMYDGLNDSRDISTEKTIQNWKSACKLAKTEGFDAIIIVQPLPITGQRVTTEQEIEKSLSNLPYLQKSQQYVDSFEELDKVCTKTADFRRVFDYVQEPVFYDQGHTMNFGNQIIAGNIFSVISPIYFDQAYSVDNNNLDSVETGVVYAVGADLSGKNFDNLNLQNAVFDKADLSNTSFKNANIDGARFAFANLDNSNLLDRTDLSNVNLAGTDLSSVDFTGKNLSDTILTGADLTDSILTGTDLSGANLSYVDLSEHDLTGTNLSNTILFRTDLSGIDLRTITLDNANFRYAILSESKLLDSLLVNNNFDYALLDDINFAGKDMSKSSFNQVYLDGSDMQNTNLSNAEFIQVDFTKIENKSLAGANLSGASFAWSNLSGVNLAGTTLHATNFWKANLSGQDFTVIDVITDRLTFADVNLSNSNFEGVDLSPKEQYFQVFKNKAHLISGITQSSEVESIILKEFFAYQHILIVSAEVRGNDLTVNYIFYNKFARANLENANFKDADLRHTSFYLADLTNADLSGADLRNAYFGNADLSNANLSAANLQGAILDSAILTGANLNCKNHPICESD
jgi:uncharacterized protein YjbI with pentapeptide repeats